MKYKMLGNTGVMVSVISLGTMNISEFQSRKEAERLICVALDAGINVLDTAEVYAQSEEVIGALLPAVAREKTLIATKIFGKPSSMNPNNCGLNRKHILSAIDNSLRRLRMDCIDILYLHGMDDTVSVNEVALTMDSLIRSGKILYYGLSNFTAWQTMNFWWHCKHSGFARPIVVQNIYNLLNRDVEKELIPCIEHLEMGFMAYNSLAGGFLAGKYNDGVPEGSRFAQNPVYYDRYCSEANISAVKALAEHTGRYGISTTELSIRWLLEKRNVSSIITGVSNLGQLAEIVDMADLPDLPNELSLECDRIWDTLAGKRQFYGRYFRRF